jgi:uncharacterized protein (DUF2336 family)
VLEVRALASQLDAGDDVLGYLSQHGAPATRRAVAANPAAPASANRRLADDDDDDVRIELARKIGRLMPGLSTDESEHVRKLTIETIEKLAQDQLPRVRAILAEEIRALDCIPRHIALALARDVEATVSASILQYSPLLSDADLKEVIAAGRASEILTAIARRRPLSESVADAIVSSLDIPAVAALLTNSDAHVRAQTLERVVEEAENVAEWHVPIVLRVDLSSRAIRRLSDFVSRSLLQALSERSGLDRATKQRLEVRLRERLSEEEPVTEGAAGAVRTEIDVALRSGKLDGSFVEAAVEQGRREIVVLALSELAEVPVQNVRHILQADTARPITALVWRAGLSMRTSFKIQRFLMKLPASALLPARSGVSFPMSEDEMNWHLSYFGIG